MAVDAARAAELAGAIGANALPVFGVALLLLLLIVGAVWWAAHRRAISVNNTPMAARARSSTVIIVCGLIALLPAALLFATLPRWIGANGWVAVADQAFTDAIAHSISLPALQLFATVTVLANTPVLWVLAIAGAIVLLWRRDFLLACTWVVAIAGNGIVTRTLKAAFARARPVHQHELFAVQGWSFPSGHSSGAVVAYGMLAYILIRKTPDTWHLPIVLIAATIAFITGCSRIFLQVHYASDVLAGFATGLAWLAVCIVAAEIIRRKRTA